MSNSEFQEFVLLVKKNLTKNGFPQSAVSFPLERMFEEADKRGFSFNKVRDVLKGENILSELVDDKVVFKALLEPEDPSQNEFAEMNSMAKELLEKMSPQEREKILDMVKNMDPSAMDAARKQWESMSPEQRKSMMNSMRKP
jgi:hypothetical protein